MPSHVPSRFSMSLSTRISLIGTVLIVLACAGALGLTMLDLRSDMLVRAGAALDRNMKLLRTTLADAGGGAAFRVENGHLVIGSHVVDETDVAVERVRDILGGTATIFLGDTRVATNVVNAEGRRATGTKLAAGPVRDAVLGRREPYRGEADILGTAYLTAYEPILDARGEILGILYVGVRKAEYLASLDATMLRAGGFGALLCLIGTAVLWFALSRAMTPLHGLERAMRRMAEGAAQTEVPGVGRGDEVGAMARAVEVFRLGLARTGALEAEAARMKADVEARRQADVHAMAQDFERAVGGIVASVTTAASRLQTTAQTMTLIATESASQSTIVAAAAEEAASYVGAVAAAAEELGSSVQEIGRQVSGSAHLAQTAVAEADQTVALVQVLSQTSDRIGDMVGMISSIAGQTNLLALNATIEAARAGEAGRGFAVVASEVKTLATQTAKATEEIARQIGEVQSVTGQAVTAIASIMKRIREISAVSGSIAAAVEQQGAATQEIVRNVAQAATGTTEVTSNVAGVARASEETGAAATHVLSAASEMSRQSEHLGAEVARFLATVRAA